MITVASAAVLNDACQFTEPNVAAVDGSAATIVAPNVLTHLTPVAFNHFFVFTDNLNTLFLNMLFYLPFQIFNSVVCHSDFLFVDFDCLF